MQDLLNAELNVPTALMCSARYKANGSDAKEEVFSNKAISNPIDFGKTSEYQLTEAKKPVFNFKEKLNAVDVSGLGEKDKHQKKVGFLVNTLAGVNTEIAEKIISVAATGLKGTYKTAIGIGKGELEKQNDGYTFVFSKK
jgi:hypothetical protein